MKTETRNTPLLQIIRENTYKSISKKKEKDPTDDEIHQYLVSLDSRSIEWIKHLWKCQKIFSLKIQEKHKIPLDRMLTFISYNPENRGAFYEIEDSDLKYGSDLGVLFYSKSLRDGGHVHVFLLIDKSFPKKIIKVFELNPNNQDDFLAEIDKEFRSYTKKQLAECEDYNLLVSIIYQYYENPIGNRYIPLHQIAQNTHLKIKDKINVPPKDPEYDKLIQKAISNHIPCHRALIDVNSVQLYKEEFIQSIPNSEIKQLVDLQNQTNGIEPLVYWDISKKLFIISDDYLSYMALIVRKIDPIQAIIMGNFPTNKAKVIESGFNELLPGMYLRESSEVSEESILDERLREIEILAGNEQKEITFLKTFSEIWIGINPIAFGLFLSPEYKNGSWYNSDTNSQEFIPWTIGHVLHTGFILPDQDQKQTFDNLDAFIQFYRNILVRQSQSGYQQKIAEQYCRLLRTSNNPEVIPFLIPEYRYYGKVRNHVHRLDFTIINFRHLTTLGVEISPWSSHGRISGTKNKTTKQINAEAQTNRNKELAKALHYFRSHNILTVIYSDDELRDIQVVFNDLKRYLQ